MAKYGRVALWTDEDVVTALLAAADGRTLDYDAPRPPVLTALPKEAAVIILRDGRHAVVDAVDYERLTQHRWFAKPMGDKTGKAYAVRSVSTPKGPRQISMHRDVIDCPPGLVVDHINGDSLDNRRANLRVCTRAENNLNIERPADLMRGVQRRGDRWVARVCIDGRMRHIGTFSSSAEAGAAAVEARRTRNESRKPT